MQVKEEEVLRIRNTRKVYIPFYLMVIALLAFIVYIKTSGRPLDDLAFKTSLAFIVATLVATEIHRMGNFYEINDNSVVHKKGYFTTVSKRIEFGAISDIDVEQNIWQRSFLFGNVQIFKFAEKSIIRNINRPFYFIGFLEKKMRGKPGRIE